MASSRSDDVEGELQAGHGAPCIDRDRCILWQTHRDLSMLKSGGGAQDDPGVRPGPCCCAPLVKGTLSAAESEDLSQLFSALADPVRLRMLSIIASADEDICSCALEDPLEKSQPTISHHTRILAEAGLIVGERRGRWSAVARGPRAAPRDRAHRRRLSGACAPGRQSGDRAVQPEVRRPEPATRPEAGSIEVGRPPVRGHHRRVVVAGPLDRGARERTADPETSERLGRRRAREVHAPGGTRRSPLGRWNSSRCPTT